MSPAVPRMPVLGDVVAGLYRIEAVLGQGGMGIVYGAQRLEDKASVAVKVLSPEASAELSGIARFVNEAWATARLESVHVVRTLDVGTLDIGLPFLVMDRLEGCDLATLIKKRKSVPIAEAVDYVIQAADAVVDANNHGIVHRNLKPSNLFLTNASASKESMIKVLDFGVSTISPLGGTAITTRTRLGSPAYMSPEQLKNSQDVDVRTDVWSLAVILYELIGGVSPFDGGAYMSLGERRVDVPAELDHVLGRCLRRAREERFADVADFVVELIPFASPAGAARAKCIGGVTAVRAAFAGPQVTTAQNVPSSQPNLAPSGEWDGAPHGWAPQNLPPSPIPWEGGHGPPQQPHAWNEASANAEQGADKTPMPAVVMGIGVGAATLGIVGLVLIVAAVRARSHHLPHSAARSDERRNGILHAGHDSRRLRSYGAGWRGAARAPRDDFRAVVGPIFEFEPQSPSHGRRCGGLSPARRTKATSSARDGRPELHYPRQAQVTIRNTPTLSHARRFVFGAVVLGALAAITSTAAAEPTKEDVAKADVLFRDAQALVQKGQLAEGCAKFAESQRLDPANGTLLNLALCHEKDGRFATAYRELNDLVAAMSGSKNPDDRERTRVASERIKGLEKKVSRVTIDATALPKDAMVSIDAERLADPTAARLVDPGSHVVDVTAPKKKPSKKVFEVKDPGAQAIKLDPLEDDTTAPAEAPAATAQVSPRPVSTNLWSSQRVLGAAVAGVGLLGMGVGAFFGLDTFSKKDERDAHCVGTKCDAEGIKLDDDARSSATISTIGFIVGSVAVVAGAFIFLTAPSKVETTGAAAPPHIRVGLGPGSLVLHGRF